MTVAVVLQVQKHFLKKLKSQILNSEESVRRENSSFSKNNTVNS